MKKFEAACFELDCVRCAMFLDDVHRNEWQDTVFGTEKWVSLWREYLIHCYDKDTCPTE